MTSSKDSFQLHTVPLAEPAAVVQAPQVRFTVLTSRLIRLEFNRDNQFEDRASQVFWHRQQPAVPFQTYTRNAILHIETDDLLLRWDTRARSFAADSLSITFKSDSTTWQFGDSDPLNLRGTARTLDTAGGAIPLEPGLMSRSGWALVDDSYSLVFDANNWLIPRSSTPGTRDLYFFGYGSDYRACLRDYSRIAGKTPLIPRWALGNWWSRYWAYTQQELTDLMRTFQTMGVPLSVCIVDMDWHITDTGNTSRGWTGYTWNKALFPNPEEFIAFLHEMGLRTALNLHPADGVHPHEEQYTRMAERLGIDPANQQPIAFDIADRDFAQAYFEILHHPYEQMGVDFWWMDWQQGTRTRQDGLDPLWWLNHLHFYDLGRDGSTRPFIFSRWGGLGNHRYPIGFSGDTLVTWESLAFQPYFTASAANVGYGWWSHDIGGHAHGVDDPEMYTRWVQFGVFSPIFRLHSTKNEFHERLPWAQGSDDVFRITRDAMRLRHALIPYLYTAAWQNYVDDLPLVRPMYFDYPHEEAAYACPQQYTFGSELIVAPFTTPLDPNTRLARQVVWLPEGDWLNFFTGEPYSGGWHAIYGRLEDIPVFAKAGAIMPLAPKTSWGGLENPAELDVHVFVGADHAFTLYEDDGTTSAYQAGEKVTTVFKQHWHDDQVTVQIGAAQGSTHLIPPQRRYRLLLHGITQDVTIQTDALQEVRYDAQTEVLTITLLPAPVTAPLTVTVSARGTPLRARRDRARERFHTMLSSFRMPTLIKPVLLESFEELRRNPETLSDFTLYMQPSQLRTLLEVMQQAGVHRVDNTAHKTLLILWNNGGHAEMTYRYTQTNPRFWSSRQRVETSGGAVPAFSAIVPAEKSPEWALRVNYFGVFTVEEQKLP